MPIASTLLSHMRRRDITPSPTAPASAWYDAFLTWDRTYRTGDDSDAILCHIYLLTRDVPQTHVSMICARLVSCRDLSLYVPGMMVARERITWERWIDAMCEDEM